MRICIQLTEWLKTRSRLISFHTDAPERMAVKAMFDAIQDLPSAVKTDPLLHEVDLRDQIKNLLRKRGIHPLRIKPGQEPASDDVITLKVNRIRSTHNKSLYLCTYKVGIEVKG